MTGRPIVITGDLPPADKTLLPYLVNEQEWGNIRTIMAGDLQSDEVKSFVYTILESWLAEGGSDFQLLPQSIADFRKAQGELKKVLARFLRYEDRREAIARIEPLHLWLV